MGEEMELKLLDTTNARPTMTAQAAAQVLLDQPYDVMVKAFEAMDKRQGEGSDRIMFAALRALATEAEQ